MLKWVVAAVMLVASPVIAQAGDAEAGKSVFGKCKGCHQIGEGAKNIAGPHLNCVVGRKSASIEGYKYSKAMKKADITWDEATLDKWVQKPKKVVRGTKMIFPAGVRDETDRANLIAYLKTECPQ